MHPQNLKQCRRMRYFFWLLIVSLIILCGATVDLPNHPSRNKEHLSLYKRAAESPEYIIKIDPNNSEADDNVTCLPTTTNAPSTVPCKTLHFAFQQIYRFDHLVIFSLVSPNYTLSNVSTFKNLKYPISIIGNSSQPAVIQCTAPKFSGLSFLHSNNITIRYIHFVGCGAVQNSTSRDYTAPKMKMLLINVTLYFYNCSNVDMYGVEVINSSQATGVVMYDTNGQIQVTKCIFYNNCADDDIPGGGGFAVEFTYCSPGDTTCPNDYNLYDPDYRSENVAAEYTFTGCQFEKNVAHGQNYTSSAGNLIFVSLANHTAVGRGGGLSVYFKGIARNKSVSISDCDFVNNNAVWGGGLLIEMDDNTISNNVQISGCNFTGNHAFFHYGTGGGGLRIATTPYFWSSIYQTENYSRNEILIECSDFTGNKAIKGGAVSFSVARQRWSYLSQVTHLLVSGCTFDNNRAQIGSAVSGILYPIFSEGSIPPINFCNCSFLSNHIQILWERNVKDALKSHPAGMGAVYMNEVPAIFSDHVTFMDNHGTALAAIGAQVNFRSTCAHFSNNSGSTGGALALLGASSILVGPNTTMNFTENNASLYGGAIYNQYVSREDLKSSVDCFFRYSDPFVGPFNWSTRFIFSYNSAKKLGNSIYSTAALPCLWAKPSTNGSYQSDYIFCSEQQWSFTDSHCKEQVYTEAHIRVSLRANTHLPIEVYPGRGFVLPLGAFDDFNHNVTNDTVYAADIQSEYAEVEPSFAYVAHNYIAITGKPGTNVNMSMYTAGYRTTNIKLSLRIMLCPPGFEYASENDTDMDSETDLMNNNEPDKYFSCRCPSKIVFSGNLRCLEHEFHSQIRNGYWIGVPEPDGEKYDDAQAFKPELFMGLIPQYYINKAPYRVEYINISSNYNSIINNDICGGANRNGTLCGTCRDGYAVAINSKIYECVLCNGTSLVKRVAYSAAYVALTYLPILGLFFAIIIFNFKLTSSAALSFVLFAQMIGSEVFSLTADKAFYLNNKNVDRMKRAYTTVYGFFNLNSLAFLIPPVCISEHLTTLDVLALEYVVAAFPIAMIIVIYLVYRCRALKCSCYERRRRNRQLCGAGISSTTTVQSTDTMQKSASTRGPRNTLIHTFVAFSFLSYTKFSLASMFTMSLTQLIDKDGNPRGSNYLYYAGHLRFSDHHYLFPYGILAIVILIFIVILPPLLLLGPIQLIDWLMDKQGFRWLQRVWPSITIHTFLDTFQGFYKPNRRFFSGIYFLFRLAIFLNFSFSQTIIEQYIFQQVAVMVLIILVALFRPYIRDFYNYLDVLILSNLGILNALAIYIYNKRFSSFPYKVYVVECILVWLPLVYMLCYAAWNRVHQRKQYNTVKDKLIHLINPTKFSQEGGTNEEHEPLLGNNPDISADKSLEESVQINTNEDPDEGLFRRATRRNRYRSTNQSQPPAHIRTGRSVSTTVVCMLEESERDLVKRDSGTCTGGSSRSGLDSNDS